MKKEIGFKIMDGMVYSYGTAIPLIDAETFEALTNNYGRDKFRVYFQRYWIEEADPETIHVLGDNYASDKKYVFLNHSKLDADLSSFEILSDDYCKDKTQAFFQGQLMENVNTQSFEVLNTHYSKDKNNIYYLTKPIEDADIENFQVLGNFAKDKNHIYSGNKIINADYESFKVLKKAFRYDSQFAIDCKQVYFDGEIITEADPASFDVLEGNYSKDKNHGYFLGKCIYEADAATFTSIDVNFAQDINNIYYNGKIVCKNTNDISQYNREYFSVNGKIFYGGYEAFEIIGIDPETFEILEERNLARDQNHLIYYDEVLKEIKIENLKISGNGFFSDNDNIYIGGTKIEVDDIESFKPLYNEWAVDKHSVYLFKGIHMDDLSWPDSKIEGSHGPSFHLLTNYCGLDKNNAYVYNDLYHTVDIVRDINHDSFELINDFYSKDKNRIYYRGTPLDADIHSFKLLESYYSRDKRYLFYGDEKITGVDLQSFKIIDHNKVLDANWLYIGNKKIAIHQASFEIIDLFFFKDKEMVYFNEKPNQCMDALSFKKQTMFYYTDKNHVYEKKHKLSLDVNKVRFINETYALDHKKVFYLNMEIVGANPKTFEACEMNYSKDDQFVFFRESKVEGADAESFEVVNYSEMKDKNYIYFIKQGKVHRRKLGSYLIQQKNV